MVKGRVQLCLVPDIDNTVNMVPVDHVARYTAFAMLEPLPNDTQSVLHITVGPPLTFNNILLSLAEYRFGVVSWSSMSWRSPPFCL
ncbi:hypothetical protein BDR03DRAFT_938446 [Suillus americanus]|nr:hypothetical protein BDR03DRAFT_938446 [Suillus americanus]